MPQLKIVMFRISSRDAIIGNKGEKNEEMFSGRNFFVSTLKKILIYPHNTLARSQKGACSNGGNENSNRLTVSSVLSMF